MRNSKPKSVSARIHLGNLPFATLSPPSMSVPTCSDHHTSLTRSSCQLDANSDSKFDVSWSSDAATSQLGQTGFDRDDPLESVLFRVSPVHLPHRCHYTPTVEYLHGPPHTLHTMPSMIQSWIFRCSKGPSWMFQRSQLDVWKSQMFGSSSQTFGDWIVTSRIYDMYIIVMVLCLAYTQLSHKACTVSTTICIAMCCISYKCLARSSLNAVKCLSISMRR